MRGTLKIVLNKSEITAGTRGASLGSEAIWIAARASGSHIFEGIEKEEIPDFNYYLDVPTVYPFAKRIDGLVGLYHKLDDCLKSILTAGEFPLVLAADHGSAGGTMAGITSAFPNKKLGVVWIDAHADIHTPYTTPTGNMHGMPLATALQIDNKECQRNVVDDETATLWNQLKSVGTAREKLRPDNLVYIGVRDTEVEEDAVMERLKIRNITVKEVRHLGVEAVIAEVEKKLADCDLIYVSFDVDSMDPDLTSYGTGTPVKNGLTPEEAKEILVGLARNPKTVCMELVEVNPCLDDKKNKMAETALHLIEAIIPEIQK